MNRPTAVLSRLAALAAILTLSGCLGYRAPTITVAEAVVTEQSDEAVCFDIALDLENPNTEELELLEFRYGVSVAGGEVYRGKRSAEATLAPQRVFRLWIPAVVRYDRVTFDASTHPRTLSWSVGGSLSYITPGEIAEILLDTGVRKPRQSFGGTGEVSLPPGG